jgi:hypothetical protein
VPANYNDLVVQGYRWVNVDGPHGCPAKADLQQITKNRTGDAELARVEQLRAYYLITGTIVQVVQEDTASGMSKIRAAGIVTDLWTFTKVLSRRPIKGTYGVIEIPEMATKVPEYDDDPRIIAETRQYLRDFNRLNEATVNARQFYDASYLSR